MSRRIVFAGGAQTRALARIYRAEIAAHTGDDVVFIGTGAVGTDAARSTLQLADMLAMEIDEDGDAIPPDGLPGQATIVRIPNLYCDFLWPFAGRAHPRNRGAFTLPGGPYPAEHGDRFLDQMVADSVDEDTALARYKAMDIVTEGELDSRLADRTDILLKLDASAGYDLASYIVDSFRSEPLFRTRQRLTMPLLRRLVAQCFTKLGVQGWTPESLRRVPFPPGAQPLHPGVIAHFGLTWVTPDQEYPVNEEGFFSFDAFGRRYMRFAWNEVLHRGIQTAKTDPAAALADLEQGLAESPESPLGRSALLAARRAAGLDHSPADPALIIDEESYDPATEGQEPELDAVADPVAAAPPGAGLAAPAEASPEAIMPAQAEAGPEPAGMPFGAPEADGISPEDALIGEAAPFAETASDPAQDMLPDAAPEPEPAPVTRFPAPSKPASLRVPAEPQSPKPGSIADGFTDFRPAAAATEAALATPGNDLIEVLPRLLPVFADLASSVDRPFGAMPEIMPPPPLRPILPPELQEDTPRPGLLARMLGRK
jgi:hypothetical protein